jgi:hypothetical protein
VSPARRYIEFTLPALANMPAAGIQAVNGEAQMRDGGHLPLLSIIQAVS